MQSDPLARLLDVSSPPLGPADVHLPPDLLEIGGVRAGELQRLLQLRNGFYAFESALHVFPSGRASVGPTLEAWNSKSLWRFEYQGMDSGCLFFGEDVFGDQFCIRNGAIFRFEAETGRTEQLANAIGDWAAVILDRYKLLTGHPLAREWQSQYGPIPAGSRLIPKTPFVAGGAYSVENLYPGDAAAGMRFRGYLANQIKNLPDGASIKFKVVP